MTYPDDETNRLRRELAAARAALEVARRRDLAARTHCDEGLLHSQRLEALGRLAGGIAHDFNNLLTVILGNAELLRPDLDDDSIGRVSLDAIAEAAEQAASVTGQLLAFARRQVIEPKVLGVSELLRGIDSILTRLLGEDIDLHIVVSRDAWPVRIDPAQFQQIVMNLAVNARDAMPYGGRLMIRARNRTVTEGCTGYPPELEPGEYLSLTVTDTGTGMSKEVLAHLFEPFFTTKPKGHGTGLGLATCHGIVKQHGGHVFVCSAVGEGTTFELLFPRARGGLELARDGDRGQPQRGCETLLLVEDESCVLDLATRCLTAQGYEVLPASNGEDALRLAEAHEGTIDLLVTDVIMPGYSGPEIAEILGTSRPELLVLFTSGYPGDAIGERGLLREGLNFLQKPYRPDQLAQRVRAILDDSAAKLRDGGSGAA